MESATGSTGRASERAGAAFIAPLAIRLLRWLIPAVLLGIALWVLHTSLGDYRYGDIAAALREIPMFRMASALAIAIMGYAVLAGYDLLALRFVGRRFRLRDIALASFLSNAVGNNVGNILLTGAAVRYWIYSAVGIPLADVAKVVLFCSIGFWLGFFALGALLFIFAPVTVPAGLAWTAATTRPIGFALLALVGAYVFLVSTRRAPLKLGSWRFVLPSIGLTAGQLVVATLDICLMGAALYVLLPDTLEWSYPRYMAIFLLALFCGTASQIPGGLGVFETVILVLLPRAITAQSAAALLAFRGIYFILPLLVAALLIGVRQGRRSMLGIRAWRERLRRRLGSLIPNILAAVVFACGVVLLFSGALPAASGRLEWLQNVEALSLIETSHFMASLVGAALLLVAHGLQRRVDGAYFVALALMAAGCALSLTKGWDYEEAIVLGAAILAMLPLRHHFYRQASLFDEPFGSRWAVSIAIVLAGSAWLTVFANVHPDYSAEAWWLFNPHAEASRSMRAAVGAVIVTVLFALGRLLHPARAKPANAGAADIERARPIAEQSVLTHANLVFRGDKALLFSKPGNAFLMYGRMGRSWIAMGHPIGPDDEVRDLLLQFRNLCDRYDGWCVFFELRPEQLGAYHELGLHFTQLGEEARIDLADFELEGSRHKDLRQARGKLIRGGCRFEVLPADAVPALSPALARISDAWLRRKATSEKGFSNASFDAGYLAHFPLAVVRNDDEIIAFANLWRGARKEELSVDLMRHLPDAPNGTMDFLFTELMLWGQNEGYRWFNFGMAPLAGLDASADAPAWHRLGNFLYRHGEHFYNFEGLRRYKQKFHPVWTPLFLASPGGIALPTVLVDVTALMAGGLAGIVLKRSRRAAHKP